MKVILAKTYGFCPGVKRAIEIAKNSKREVGDKNLFILREIVHNPQAVADLGVKSVKNLNEVPDNSTIIFSSHGVSPQVFDEAREKNLTIVDATCPLVIKVHALIRAFAKKGYQIIYIGDKDHDEVLGVMGEAENQILIVDTVNDYPKQLEKLTKKVKDSNKLVLLTQTTLSVAETRELIKLIKKQFPKILLYNTICEATTKRQEAVYELAKKVAVIIVVGGKNSANSRRLKEAAEESGVRGYQVEEANELKKIPLGGINIIGVTAGASTPDWVIREVVQYLEKI